MAHEETVQVLHGQDPPAIRAVKALSALGVAYTDRDVDKLAEIFSHYSKTDVETGRKMVRRQAVELLLEKL